METILAGHYQIVKHLSGGGFGQTFLAKDSHLPGNPLCVVKQLKPRASDPETLQTAKRLFTQEAETLYRLGDHDQIPRLFAHFEEDREFYLVQEFIEGQPLDQELSLGRQLSEASVIVLLQDMLQVLAFVHQQNVIHRDIKPSNLIRRSRDSKIVLIDFGAVKEVREVMNQAANIQGHSNLTVAIGSPGYMPSEQQSFHPHFSSDIYAVGIVCIQALIGLNPRELPKDSRSKEVCCSLLTDRAPVSPGLAEILDRMVRYDYRQRYENAIEALQALQELTARSDHQIIITASETVNLLSELPNQGTELTEAINPVNELPNQGTEPSQLPTTLQDVPKELKKQLERLLAGVIGPVASLILKQALDGVQTYEDLVDRLAVRLSEKERAKFREQASRLFKDQNLSLPVTSQHKASATTARPTPPNTPAHTVDPSFIKCCELELAKAIGSVAPLIVQRTLSQKPNLSRIQLIETLAQHLPNSVKIEAFRQSLLIFL